MKRIFFTFAVIAAVVSQVAAVRIEVAPGELAVRLPRSVDDGALILTGSIDARDFEALATLPTGVETIDMTGVRIAELRSSTPLRDGRTYFPAGEIPEYAFFKSDATTILLPATLTGIGDGAFAHSAITSVSLPAGVATVGAYAFYGCPALHTVKLSESLASVGTGSFGNCVGIEDIDFSGTRVNTLPERVLAGCSALGSVKLSPATAAIGPEAFEGTAVETLDLSGVGILEDFALAGMPRLKSVRLREGVVLGKGVVMDDGTLEKVVGYSGPVPALFAANSPLLDPSAMTEGGEMGDYAFSNSSVETLVLGAGLRSIGAGTFSGLANLALIDARALEADVPEVEADTFHGIDPSEVKLHVALATPEIWRAHPVWGEFDVVDDLTVDVQGVASDASGITVTVRGSYLIVEAPETLVTVAVYTADGRNAGVWHPATTSAAISLENLPEGIILVKSETTGSSRSVKVMTR